MHSYSGKSNDFDARIHVSCKRVRSRHRGLAVSYVLLIGNLALASAPPELADDDQKSKAGSKEARPDVSPARFDQNLGVKGWNIPFPSFGDSLLQDVGGFRTALANLGIGFLAYSLPQIATNLLNTPRQTNGSQVYWGQQFSAFIGTMVYLTVDAEHYGVPGGQLQLSWQFTFSSWQFFIPDTASLNRLAYYQSLFDKKIELLVGYMTNDTVFVGAFLGSNLASPFGPASSIPVELGLASPPAVAPSANIKLNLGHFYNVFAVQRSLPPMGDPFVTNDQLNPTGFRFTVDRSKVLLVDEAGYKRLAAPNVPYCWIRLGALYNTSPYTDFSQPNETVTNFGAYVLVDRQVLQLDSSSPDTAYRGLYLGGSAEYGSPKANVISQYYEARAYILAPFRSRPKDQIGLVYIHQVFSHYLRDSLNRESSSTNRFAQSSSNTITPSYTGNVIPGLYATVALSYTDNPSFVFVKGEGHALTFLASLFIAL